MLQSAHREKHTPGMGSSVLFLIAVRTQARAIAQVDRQVHECAQPVQTHRNPPRLTPLVIPSSLWEGWAE